MKDLNEFSGNVILITGATSGIGKASAIYFLNKGAQVILVGRDEKSLDKIGNEFPKQVITVKLDLTKDDEVKSLKPIIELQKRLDVIINCAGVMFDSDVEKTYPHDFDYSIDCNLRSVFILINLLKGFMKPGLRIINISCLYSSRPSQGCISYAISKKGLEALTRSAAYELAELGVRVNAITASPVDTNCYRMVDVKEKEFKALKDRISKNIPLQRMASPDDIVKAIQFLASNSRSAAITGQIIKVDGGRALTTGGYVPWKGIRKMNGRYEPDGEQKASISDIYNRFFPNKKEKKPLTVPFEGTPIETKTQFDLVVKESNWSTKNNEAHTTVLSAYKQIDQTDAFLKDTFLNKDKNNKGNSDSSRGVSQKK